MVRVKICGITNLDDALAAVEYGADALGFVFAPSPRQVKPGKVKRIVAKLPPFVCKVGVFVNSDLEFVKQTMAVCNLNLAQLHGNESPDYCAALFPRAIKVFTNKNLPPIEKLARYRVAAYMLDKDKSASSSTAEQKKLWKIARQIGEHGPVILAGGLTPENVSEAIKVARPYAVDVSSGIEMKPGIKDHKKMRDFLAAAKVVSQHRAGALPPATRSGRQSARSMDEKPRKHLPRYNLENECHFVTSVTRNRRQVFKDVSNLEILVNTIKFYRERGDFYLLGYVIMPDHFHLTIVPQKGTISDILRNIKAYTGTAIRQRMKIKSDIWQDSFYDHIIMDTKDLWAKLNYMHENPIRKGIVHSLDTYRYSSYINLYTDREPVLQIDTELNGNNHSKEQVFQK